MTTIAAVAANGIVSMAGDRQTNVYDRPIDGVHKVWRIAPAEGDPLLLGFAGDGALPTLVTRHLTAAVPGPDADPVERWQWAHTIASAITEIALDHAIRNDQGRMDATVLLAHNGAIWTLTHHQAMPHHDGIAALGSGDDVALGAIDALLLAGHTDPRYLVRTAIKIASNRNRYTGGGIDIQTIGPA